jgi:hypothetical protein
LLDHSGGRSSSVKNLPEIGQFAFPVIESFATGSVMDGVLENRSRQFALSVEWLQHVLWYGRSFSVLDIIDKHNGAKGLKNHERTGIPFGLTAKLPFPIPPTGDIADIRILDMQQQAIEGSVPPKLADEFQ